MSKGKVILPQERFSLTCERICQNLIEKYDDFADVCIIGVQDRGAIFSDRIVELLHNRKITDFDYGKIGIN